MRSRFPTAPVVLGAILAPLADSNLRRALLLSENNGLPFLLKQYVRHVLVLAIAAVFIEGLLRGRRAHLRAEAARREQGAEPARPV